MLGCIGNIVPENQIDPHLAAWQELEPYGWRSLLLGNGFSINIWERFAYTSLFNVATSGDVDPVLDATMFEKLGTSNFEDVLRALYHARIVDEQLNSPQRNEIEAIYSRTKNSLAAAVNFAHVPHGITALLLINNAFRSFSRIYTTNYDLLPYWAIMHTDVWRFKDLFWGENNTFDPKDTSVNVDKCAIYYLHGAIHLVELPDGKTKKLVGNGLTTLADLFDLEHPEYFPLFISEGTSEGKLSRIKRNDYLRFAFEKFQTEEGNLVVLGHSLHKDYDQHLTDALSSSGLVSIAVGVWPHQPEHQILVFKSRLMAELAGKNVYFFDSTTHPLGDPQLRYEV
jgi:hypothetical protein